MSDKIENQGELSVQEIEALEEYQQADPEDLPDKDITHQVRLSMKRRFSFPEWILLYEFPSPSGRLADAIAVNLNTSQNFKIVGFEFKASRSDWLSEKKNGRKSNYFVEICDEWYVVAGRTGIVEEEELPAGWGLLEMKPNSKQLWKLVESELTEHQQGEPDRYFWTRFVKKTVGNESNFSTADMESARKRGYAEAADEIQAGGDGEISKRKLKRLRQKANSYDKLNDGLGFIPWRNLSEERARTFELAYKLINIIDSNRYGTLSKDLEQLQGNIERETESMAESAEQIERGIDILRDRIEDGHDPREADQ